MKLSSIQFYGVIDPAIPELARELMLFEDGPHAAVHTGATDP